MPMWVPSMYYSIGNLWSGLTFAFIAVFMLPSASFPAFSPSLSPVLPSRSSLPCYTDTNRVTVPFVAFFWGDKIRAKSKMAIQ